MTKEDMDCDDNGNSCVSEEILVLSRKLGELESQIEQQTVEIEKLRESNTCLTNDHEMENTHSICELIQHLFSQSTLHGLPNIATASRGWIKIFWILLLVGGTVISVWQTVQIFTEYFSFPVLTLTQVVRGNTEIPQITFCNSNGYLRSKILQANGPLGDIDEDMLPFIEYDDLLFRISLLPEADRINMSHRFEEFIVLPDTSTLDYEQLPSTQYGNCYTLIPKNFQQEELKISFYINLRSGEHLSQDISLMGLAFIREKGIFPHSYSEPYFEIKSGYQVHAHLQKERIIRLTGKYKNCQEYEKEFYEETGIKYSEEVCLARCLSEKLLARCGCINRMKNSFPKRYKISKVFENVSDCSTHNNQCYMDNQALTKDDDCVCKPRCDTRTYKLSDIKRRKIKKDRIEWLCVMWDDCRSREFLHEKAAWVKNNSAEIEIRIPQSNHKEYRQVPAYPLSKFLSDLGGTLGLYLGISLMTLAELPQLMIGAVIHFLQNKKR